MSQKGEKSYSLVFVGRFPGKDRPVGRALARVFERPENWGIQIVSNAPIVVLENLTERQARNLHAALAEVEAAGSRFQIEEGTDTSYPKITWPELPRICGKTLGEYDHPALASLVLSCPHCGGHLSVSLNVAKGAAPSVVVPLEEMAGLPGDGRVATAQPLPPAPAGVLAQITPEAPRALVSAPTPPGEVGPQATPGPSESTTSRDEALVEEEEFEIEIPPTDKLPAALARPAKITPGGGLPNVPEAPVPPPRTVDSARPGTHSGPMDMAEFEAGLQLEEEVMEPLQEPAAPEKTVRPAAQETSPRTANRRTTQKALSPGTELFNVLVGKITNPKAIALYCEITGSEPHAARRGLARRASSVVTREVTEEEANQIIERFAKVGVKARLRPSEKSGRSEV